MLKQANAGPWTLLPKPALGRRPARACVTGRTIGRAGAARRLRDPCPARCGSSGNGGIAAYVPANGRTRDMLPFPLIDALLGVPSGSVSSRKTFAILGLAVSWLTWTK